MGGLVYFFTGDVLTVEFFAAAFLVAGFFIALAADFDVALSVDDLFVAGFLAARLAAGAGESLETCALRSSISLRCASITF